MKGRNDATTSITTSRRITNFGLNELLLLCIWPHSQDVPCMAEHYMHVLRKWMNTFYCILAFHHQQRCEREIQVDKTCLNSILLTFHGNLHLDWNANRKNIQQMNVVFDFASESLIHFSNELERTNLSFVWYILPCKIIKWLNCMQKGINVCYQCSVRLLNKMMSQ